MSVAQRRAAESVDEDEMGRDLVMVAMTAPFGGEGLIVSGERHGGGRRSCGRATRARTSTR